MAPSALSALPLDAADGFVLSRVDGLATQRALADLTGLPESQIHKSLEKLASLKVIEFVGAQPSASSKPGGREVAQQGTSAPETGRPAGSPSLHPEADARVPADSGHSSSVDGISVAWNPLVEAAVEAVSEDAPELTEPGDLPGYLRRLILGMHSVMPSLDHYGLLAVSPDADKRTIKHAYFEIAGLFHPDRYFRKNLGSLKPKMEAIFARTSAAYEVLSSRERRAEYDGYLADVQKSRNLEAMLRNVMAEVESAERSAIEQAGSSDPWLQPSGDAPSGTAAPGAPAYDAPASDSPVASRHPSGTMPATNLKTPAPTSASSVSDKLRREALAMRLMRGNRAAAESVRHSVTKPPGAPPAHQSGRMQAVTAGAPAARPVSRPPAGDGGDALRRRYEERVEAGRRHQGEKYVKLGQGAEARNDLTAAASAYRVALNFLREEDPSYARAREVIAKSEAALGETYVRQAQHEERAGRWEDAVRSWGRAAKLRPQDHVTQERYANALVKSSGDLHEAAQYAQKAIALAPGESNYRCTLASVYVAAGLLLNARRELEAAAVQFPENANIQALLKNVPKSA